MKVEGYCLIHNKEIHGVQMVTKAIHKAWKNGELWQEIQFIPIRHMGFYIEPSTCWVLKEEYEPLNLPVDRILDDNETDRFLDWFDERLEFLANCCFKEWQDKRVT